MNAPSETIPPLHRMLIRWWAAATPALVGCTWPLWLPGRAVPRVAPLSLLAGVPAFLDYALLCLLGLCCLYLVAYPDSKRTLAWSIASLGGLMVVDQLRWQPWAYHLLVAGVVLALADPTRSRRWLGWLAVSVYFFSGVSKLDYAFGATMGRQLIEAALGIIGVAPDVLPEQVVLAAALSLPALETAIALLLLLRPTRAWGLALAVAMHLGTIILLSPLGLDHMPGVLAWNAVFLTHVALLYWPKRDAVSETHVERPLTTTSIIAAVVVACAIVAPLTRPLGVWDRWPSWGLYAPGGERTDLYVHRTVASRLPKSLPLEPAADDPSWRQLKLDDWMLHESYAPLYPQRRTTLALALKLNNQARLGSYVRAVLQTPAGRFSGGRTTQVLQGDKEIREYNHRYWLTP